MAVGFEPNTEENLRARLVRMKDPELLRYGQAARSCASPEANFGKEPSESAKMHLRAAREEWRRRHPKLPLS